MSKHIENMPKQDQYDADELTEYHNGSLTVAEAGRRGGLATRNNQGIDFFKKIGRKGGEVTRKRYSHLLSEFGKKGGRPRRPSLDEYGEEKQ